MQSVGSVQLDHEIDPFINRLPIGHWLITVNIALPWLHLCKVTIGQNQYMTRAAKEEDKRKSQ